MKKKSTNALFVLTYECPPNAYLKQNIKSVHEKKKSIKCPICDYCYSAIGSLKQHIKLVHEVKNQYKYTICDYSFSRKGCLKRHIKSVHERKKRTHQCLICNYSCSTNHNLKLHVEGPVLYTVGL